MYRQSETDVKQQYLLHMSSQYGELRRTNGWDRLASLGHPGKFQGLSRLGFVTAPTSLNGGQPNFARCLAVSWAGTLYIHFSELLPLSGIVPGAKFTMRPSSPILAALLHGTRGMRFSQTLRHRTRNGITELSLILIFNRGWHLYSEGGHHVRHRPTFQLQISSYHKSLVVCNEMKVFDISLLVTLPFIMVLTFSHVVFRSYLHFYKHFNIVRFVSCYMDFNLLWPPCVADADIIFLPCGFFLLYIFLFFLA